MKSLILKFCLTGLLLSLNLSAIRAQNIVACYPFNTNANNSVSSNHNGNIFGAVPTADRFGAPNQAYAFDGVNDYILIPHHPDLNFDVSDDFTLSLWVLAPPIQNDAQVGRNGFSSNEILNKWEDNGNNDGYPYGFRIFNQSNAATNQNGQVRGLRWDKNCNNFTDVSSKTAMNDSVYHHLVMLKTGDTISIYIDNVLDTTFLDLSVCSNLNTDDLYLGKRGGTANTNFFTGAIDDFIIYDYAISLAQINCLYTTTASPCNCENLSIATAEISECIISVYPNPVTDKITVENESNSSEINNVSLFSANGGLLLSLTPNSAAPAVLDMKSKAPGLYFIKVKTAEGVSLVKIIKD